MAVATVGLPLTRIEFRENKGSKMIQPMSANESEVGARYYPQPRAHLLTYSKVTTLRYLSKFLKPLAHPQL